MGSTIPRYDFDSDIRIFNLGDVHRGDRCCNVDLFLRIVKYIEKDPKAYWISTGDLLNVALKTSVTDVHASDALEEEYEAIQRELKPIAKKCLGIVSSNHHKRFEKAVGMNLDKLLCRELGVPYIGISGIIMCVVGSAPYYMAMHHGIGGGRMRGGKANNLERLALIYPGCDIYMEGHTHTFDYFINKYKYIDRKRGNLVKYDAHFCYTAHFLSWDGSYGEDAKFPLTPEGSAVLTLFHRTSGNFARKKIKCELVN